MPAPVPAALPVADAAALAGVPSFCGFMERCLHHPETGYYAAGRVQFGFAGDFWTFPTHFAPLFGIMVAEWVRVLLRDMLDAGHLPAEGPLTVLELGAGDGDLAASMLGWIASRAADPSWAGIAGRVRVVIGERSAALRTRQSERLKDWIAAGWAEVREVDARQIRWEGDFHGVVVANELVDAFAVERLRLRPDGTLARVHVGALPEGAAAEVEAGQVPPGTLTEDALWAAVAAGEGLAFFELDLPLAAGWWDGGRVGPVPPGVQAWEERVRPLLDDLVAAGAAPCAVHVNPAVPDFMDGLGALIGGGPGRRGGAILIDYGGTTRHFLDPRSRSPHLRVYGPAQVGAQMESPYTEPGARDLTCDVDFTELAALAEPFGLVPLYYGPQRAIETPELRLTAPEWWPLVEAPRREEVGQCPFRVAAASDAALRSFRSAPGFMVLVLGPAGTARPTLKLALDVHDLRTVAPTAPRRLAAAFAHRRVPRGVWRYLIPGCEVHANLSDQGYEAWLPEVRSALESLGALVPPGALARRPAP